MLLLILTSSLRWRCKWRIEPQEFQKRARSSVTNTHAATDSCTKTFPQASISLSDLSYCCSTTSSKLNTEAHFKKLLWFLYLLNHYQAPLSWATHCTYCTPSKLPFQFLLPLLVYRFLGINSSQHNAWHIVLCYMQKEWHRESQNLISTQTY